MVRSVKNFPIVPIVSLLLLSALLAGCRVVAEKPAQTAYPVPATRQVVAQPTHPPATKPSGSATAQPTHPPATKPSGSATAQPTRPPATKKPAQATAVPATAGRATRLPTATPPPSPTPAPTRGDVAFSLTILYTGEVHGEVRPCG